MLARMGPMPTSSQRLRAHEDRAAAAQVAASQKLAAAVARRSRPARKTNWCPAKAEIVRTLTATAAESTTRASEAAINSNPEVVETSTSSQPALRSGSEASSAARPQAVLEYSRPVKAARVSLASERGKTEDAITNLLGRRQR